MQITLNRKTFSHKKPQNSDIGFFTTRGKSIQLFNLNGIQIGVITARGILARVSILDDGKKWYSYGNIEGIGQFESFKAREYQVESIIQQLAK